MVFLVWRLSHPSLFSVKRSAELAKETSSTTRKFERGPSGQSAEELKKQSHYIEDFQGVFANHPEHSDYQHNVDNPPGQS
jgi:hypothetical protein